MRAQINPSFEWNAAHFDGIYTTHREFWCDGIRCVAILMVILNHSLEFIYSLNTASDYLSYSRQIQFFSTFVFGIGRGGVPLFLFLTGYLMLSKKMSDHAAICRFYKRNFLSLLITIEAWIIIISVYLKIIGLQNYTLKGLLLSMIFWQQVPWMQMWYVPFIVGVYLGLPFLNCIVNNLPQRLVGSFWVVIFFFALILPTISIFIPISDPFLLKNVLYGVGYNSYSILYLVAGYYLGGEKVSFLNRVPTWLISVYGIVCFLLNWMLQMHVYECGMDIKFGYDIITGFLCWVSLFIILRRVFGRISYNRKNHVIQVIAQLSFGAYFLHAEVQHSLLELEVFRIFPRYISVFLLFALSTVITFLILYPLSKFKITKRVLLNARL